MGANPFDANDPTEFHGVFMLNHVIPQMVLGAFTQNFYFGAFMQVLVNFMIFNVLLPPRPLPFPFLVELNITFVIAQFLGTLTGIFVARTVNVSPILEVSFPWEHRRYAWPAATWGLSALIVTVLLGIIPGILYDFGVSVFTPGNFLLWGLLDAVLLLILYYIVSLILSSKHFIGPCLPFIDVCQVRQFARILGLLHIIFVLTWTFVNHAHVTDAATLIWVMVGLVVFSWIMLWIIRRTGRSCRGKERRRKDVHNYTAYYEKIHK